MAGARLYNRKEKRVNCKTSGVIKEWLQALLFAFFLFSLLLPLSSLFFYLLESTAYY
jgi:hypothetical protein